VRTPEPVVLAGHGIRLEPLEAAHEPALAAAAADGALWERWYTSVPAPQDTGAYVRTALDGYRAGHMLPWAIRRERDDRVLGSTRYHDIVPELDRVEIGYTWLARSAQRSAVNTICKLLLFEHAFETLGCEVVALRTDGENLQSRRAIAALGARQDGILRHHRIRRDGSAGDTVLFSVLRGEWRAVRQLLHDRLERHGAAPGDSPRGRDGAASEP
jgi:RimJ/RimL family protein N-acetyltransferase